MEACQPGPGRCLHSLGGWARTPAQGAACLGRPATRSLAGSPVMSRYRSSCWSRRRSSCDVDLRLFFTPCEDAEQRREQGGAAAQLGRRSFFRFMEAAAARQGATTMAPSARSPAEPPPTPRASAWGGGRGAALQRRRVPVEPGGRRPRRSRRRGRAHRACPAPSCGRRGTRAAALATAPPAAAGAPQPAPRSPEPAGAAEVTALPPAAGSARGNRARPPRQRTVLPRRGRTAGRGSRGPQEGCSVELHSQKRAHNPPRGPQTGAFHWSVMRDVTQTRPFYRQVPGDAIKKSLSGSANQT